MNNDAFSKYPFSLGFRLLITVYGLALITGLFCAGQSVKTAHGKIIENAYETALNEQFRIGFAIKKTAENQNYTKENESLYLLGTVRNSADNYSEYYDADASYRITADEAGTVYSNISDEDVLLLGLEPKRDGTVSCFITRQGNGKMLIIVSSYIKIYQSLFRLDYIGDISYVREVLEGLSKRISATLFITEVLLFFALSFTIKKTLKPLNSLQNQAIAIAKGDYNKRAEIIHNDEVGQLAGSINDMSEAVREHVRALSETARLKELFAANLAHEIKTPLTAIVAYSDYAAKRNLDGDALQKILEYIKMEGRRVGSLSDKILKWNRINNKNELDIKPCRPQRIIRQALYTLGFVAKKRSQKVIVKNHTSIIYADEALLISLILNLCKNALAASDDGKSICLALENDESKSLIIKVSDSGIGIEGDELKRVTEPFYMVDKSRDRAKGGAGLGLPLCLAITEAHNGTMDINSVFGEGTLVTVTIPQKA